MGEPSGAGDSRPPRGRRPGGPDTREDILNSARKQFAENGFRAATMRQIATGAGVDPRLVTHYFGSKADLFVAAVELPLDLSELTRAIGGDRSDVGRRVATFVFSVLDNPVGRETILGLIRAAASEDQALQMLRERLTTQVLIPVARRLGSPRAELRATLVASQVYGIILARYAIEFPPLVQASSEQLIELTAPVFQHYLTAPLPDGN